MRLMNRCIVCRFEIKCLSKRLSIKVDNHLYSAKDEAVALKNKSLITVGKNKLIGRAIQIKC